ncbi:MAG: radical SAM protein [Candidatus Woesearchaeota archaeon]
MDEFLRVISDILNEKINLANKQTSYHGYEKIYARVRFIFSDPEKRFSMNLDPKSSSINCIQTELFNISITPKVPDGSVDSLVKLFSKAVAKAEERFSQDDKDKIMEFFPKDNMYFPENLSSVKHILLTDTCNVRCKYCKYSDFDSYVERKAVDLLKSDIRDIRREHSEIGFDGGEPTTHPNFLELARYAKGIGFNSISVITNGVNLADPNLMHGMAEAGVSHINFSFSAHTPELSKKIYGKDVSRMHMKAFENFKKMRTLFSITVQIIIVDDNQDHLHEIIDKALSINPDNLTLINPFSRRDYWDGHPDLDKIDVDSHLDQVTKNGNTEFKIRHFPFCKVSESLWDYMEELDYYEEVFKKADVCQPCVYKDNCIFSSRSYLNKFTDKTFAPIIKRITDDFK